MQRFLPYVRAHAFSQRLKRMLKSLDAKGMLDPDTGLLGQEAFWRDLNRAVDDAERRGVGLSIARFSFDGGDRRHRTEKRAIDNPTPRLSASSTARLRLRQKASWPSSPVGSSIPLASSDLSIRLRRWLKA